MIYDLLYMLKWLTMTVGIILSFGGCMKIALARKSKPKIVIEIDYQDEV